MEEEVGTDSGTKVGELLALQAKAWEDGSEDSVAWYAERIVALGGKPYATFSEAMESLP